MCIFITPDLLTFASKVTYRIYVSQVHLNSHAITYNKVEIPVIKRSFFEFGLYFFSALKLSILNLKVVIVTGGVTETRASTDTTEMFLPWDYHRKEWQLLPNAKLPQKMDGMAMVSIYNNLYLTGNQK